VLCDSRCCHLRDSRVREEAAGDWIGQLSGGFKVRIHISKANSVYSGYFTNPQEEAIAAGPLPYRQDDITFENVAGRNRLAGTLTMPQGAAGR
jgi:hypothetical protein